VSGSGTPVAAKPQPVINALTEPYWLAVSRGELTLQRCESCRHWIHFPEPRCPQCGSKSLAFEQVSGSGEVESFSVIHRSFVEGYADEPYVIAWISLPEQENLRVMSNIINCSTEDVEIGQAVELCFEQRGDFGQIPQFALSEKE
jgi:uncharacterized OB-fold protein